MISLNNKNKYILYVKKMNLAEALSFLVFIIPILLPTFLQFFNGPSIAKYIVDVFVVGLFFILIVNRRLRVEKRVLPFFTLFIFFFITCFVVYIFNFQSVFYFLWGCRNNFRFYIAFLAYIMFLESDDSEQILKFLDVLFWINAIISLYQHFVLGYSQDFLGGIFGVERGCNSSTLIFFSIFISKSLLMYMQGKEKSYMCWLKCAVTLFISALAELKVFFLFFAVILIFAALFTKFSWKKVLLFFVSLLLIQLSNEVFLSFVDSEISIEKFIDLITADSYSSGMDIGRFSAISTISKLFHTDFWEKLFGMGLGNCDTSSFAVCNTQFYQTYQALHYNWFSSAFLYLETGLVGLLLTLSVFVLCFIMAARKRKSGECNELYCLISMIMSVICIALIFYNSSLRMEIGYMAYFALALPFISSECQEE